MIAFLLYPISLILNLFPKKFLLCLTDCFGSVFFYAVGFRREVILNNLRLAFGSQKSEHELRQIAKRNYQHYAAVFIEMILSISWDADRYRREVIVDNWEKIEPIIKRGHGGFILTSHLGNWEYSIGGGAAHGVPLDVVVKQSRTKMVERFLQWYRRKTGAGIFLESNTAREIIRSVNQGRLVAFILDQFMGPPIGLPVTFFGHKAGTAVALALFTEKWEVPVISAYNYRDANGRIHFAFGEFFDFSNLSPDKDERLFQKTQMFNDAMEADIRKHPEQWLWLHRRWKEFRGEPRWSVKRVFVSMFTVTTSLFISACASKGNAPTGIELPPDPTIVVPAFDETKSEGDRTELTAPHNDSIRDVVVVPRVEKKKKAKTMAKPENNPADKMPASENKTTDSFAVVPLDRIPFEVGERLEMELGWTALPAGRAVLETRRGPDFNGRPTFHLWGNVLSSKIVDAIYHVDNTIESFVDTRGLIPYKFLLHMVESKQLKETRVSFDHPHKRAYYWAKRISQRWGNQDIDRQDEFIPQGRDMFSALYYARSLNYQMGRKQFFTVYENGQNWNIELTPVANELVTSRVGAFQCWKILVNAKINNVLAPTGDLYLWLSDDSKKYPVKFDAKIKIGSLYGLLTSIRER